MKRHLNGLKKINKKEKYLSKQHEYAGDFRRKRQLVAD